MGNDYVGETCANSGVLSVSPSAMEQIVEKEFMSFVKFPLATATTKKDKELFKKHQDELFSAMSAYGDKIRQL